MNALRLLLGRRLANREYGERKIGAFEGVPAMGLDGLGSSAYGPEAALTIMIPLGAASLTYIGWVMACSRCRPICSSPASRGSSASAFIRC
jgi:threonine/homoserine/homoserine lactone efflux protein